MTPDEFIKRLNNAVVHIAKDMEPTMQEAALTGKALLTKRIQSQGFGKNYRSRSYIRLRAKKGFEVRFVNLTFSGNMLRGWNVPGNYKRGLVVGGSVGGVNQMTKDKLKWNHSRFPTFDQSSKEERELIWESLVKPQLIKSVKKNLGI